jgi:hypothetical protein
MLEPNKVAAKMVLTIDRDVFDLSLSVKMHQQKEDERLA